MTTTSTRQPAEPTSVPPTPSSRRARQLIAVVVIAALLVGAWLAVVRIGLGDDAADNESVLELSMGQGDALASCAVFDVEVLAAMSPAFAGTVTSVADGQVMLEVNRWYTGGDAQTVRLEAPQGLAALIGGVAFAPGEAYLITASGGVVNYCGFSGPATPELTAAFEAAFGG